MNILDGTLSALEQYDPDNHIKISVIDFLTGLDACFEKDRIICAQGGIYIPVQIAPSVQSAPLTSSRITASSAKEHFLLTPLKSCRTCSSPTIPM